MSIVTFKEDIDGYCKNDVVDLDADQKKAIDAIAVLRKIDTPYVSGDHRDVVEVQDARERDAVVAKEERRAAAARAVETDATLRAQKAAQAVTANGPSTSANSSAVEAKEKADQAEADAKAASEAADALEKAAESTDSTPTTPATGSTN